MKIFAYMTVCLCLPLALLAEDEEPEAVVPSPDDDAETAETVTDPGFERFKTILDRMPFGRPPPGFNPDAPGGSVDGKPGTAEEAEAVAEAEASEVEQQIISSVRVSMLNRTADGRVFVGFTDSSVQPAKNYMLELGEKREQCEWQVVDADPDNRQVTLSKGGVEATLKVGGGAGSSDDKKAKDGEEGEKVAARPGPFRGRMPPRAPVAESEEAEDRKMSALDRVRARRQRNLEMQRAEMEQRRQADEQAKKEREQEKKEREMAAEERKAQLDQLMQIQEELRRQREEKLAERERRAAAEEAPQTGDVQEPVEE